jgi:two-component system, cell cycle response regulator DivK
MSRILLIEDDPDCRTIVRTYLEHVGFEVLEENDGEEGVKRAREEAPDLILMDISLGGIDGWEATRILKADPRTAPIPIIVLTAHALTRDQERSREAGCDGYLAKPVDPKHVAREVRRTLEGRGADTG